MSRDSSLASDLVKANALTLLASFLEIPTPISNPHHPLTPALVVGNTNVTLDSVLGLGTIRN